MRAVSVIKPDDPGNVIRRRVAQKTYLQKRYRLPTISTSRSAGTWKALRDSLVKALFEIQSSMKAGDAASFSVSGGKASRRVMYLSRYDFCT